MKPAITLKDITQKLMKEKYEYNLVPQKKTVLPAHLAKGLSKRSKKMIEAYQIKIKKAVVGKKKTSIEDKKSSFRSDFDMNFSTKTNTFYGDRTDTKRNTDAKVKIQQSYSSNCKVIFPPHITSGRINGVDLGGKISKANSPKRNVTMDASNTNHPIRNIQDITLERISSPNERLKSPIVNNDLARLLT
eukprot:CAMPEP_0197018430 /NCGR_PEP_ID=MMETSP1380-20130617/80096_1 /TAXON_ID=5936 /ORGANISM="Euplotes crassus, Strain CT5" /LENGTH=188 /DNA_ID=CAMNT_0042445647 /DNA_START=430 /DNA_END=997 /DNA_ORIENTATION=+